MKKQIAKRSFLLLGVLLYNMSTLAGCSSTGMTERMGTEGLQYEFDESTYSYGVCGYVGVDTNVYVPSSWQGYPVTSILKGAFYQTNVLLNSIVVSSSVYRVEQNAFRGNIFIEPDFTKYIDYIIFEADNIYFEQNAFYECNVEHVQFKGQILNYNGCIFYDCFNLLALVLSNNVINTSFSSSFVTMPSALNSIFYLGAETDDFYSFASDDSSLANCKVWCYSKKEPTVNRSNYWYYVGDVPHIWGVTITSADPDD